MSSPQQDTHRTVSLTPTFLLFYLRQTEPRESLAREEEGEVSVLVTTDWVHAGVTTQARVGAQGLVPGDEVT